MDEPTRIGDWLPQLLLAAGIAYVAAVAMLLSCKFAWRRYMRNRT